MNTEILMSPSFRFFALPSFAEGIASVIDLAGSFHNYNDNKTPAEADCESLRSDWDAIGADMRAAIDKAREELKPVG